SRKARAITFAPRSCPSSPGFATRTRIGRVSAITMTPLSDCFCCTYYTVILCPDGSGHRVRTGASPALTRSRGMPGQGPALPLQCMHIERADCALLFFVHFFALLLKFYNGGLLAASMYQELCLPDNLASFRDVDHRHRQVGQHMLLYLRLHPFVGGIQYVDIFPQQARIEQSEQKIEVVLCSTWI